jgi:holo-[acyl-carrier protein] synthase
MDKMAVHGIGIDLVRSDRLGETLNRWGERFTRRVFTPAEVAACAGRKRQLACLATRFAAKEAFVKALGRGMRSPVLWTDIQVQNDDLGKPEICLSSRALEFCRNLGIRSWHLSLTDDGDYGAAVVILET